MELVSQQIDQDDDFERFGNNQSPGNARMSNQPNQYSGKGNIEDGTANAGEYRRFRVGYGKIENHKHCFNGKSGHSQRIHRQRRRREEGG